MNDKPKVGLFFGAGAEVAYGLPSGGRFALEIFRMDAMEDKQPFKETLKLIDRRSLYATKWLPDEYDTRSVSTFGKNQYLSLIISSLENKRSQIIHFLNHFDHQAETIVKRFSENRIDIKDKFKDLTGKNVGTFSFSHEVKLNEAFGGTIRLFESKFFSAILQVLETKGREKEEWVGDLKNIVRSFIELLIGAVGEDFLHRINDSIFEKKPDGIDIFDDFCGYFKFDYKSISGLDYVLGSRFREITDGMEAGPAVTEFARRMLEEVFVVALDYQSLIDSYYRYLSTPKTDWGKFCKIAIFLMTVRRYITQNLEDAKAKVINGDGYYQDILQLQQFANIQTIGTTNYNTFLNETAKTDAVYLNGCVNDYYDPYRNKIIPKTQIEKSGHLCVPFLFTQSGIKPLTSVSMSRRYVDLFDQFKICDVIGVVGFGFNSDDGHINGLFRELIEDEGKKVVIFHYPPETPESYSEKLRLSKDDGLIIEHVDANRKCGELDWFKKMMSYCS